jgi:hypothetical protein
MGKSPATTSLARYIPARIAGIAMAAELIRISGVDALRVDGINLITFQTVVAELGMDLGNWYQFLKKTRIALGPF